MQASHTSHHQSLICCSGMWSEEDVEWVLDGTSRLGWLVLKKFSSTYRPSEVMAAFSVLSKADFDEVRRLHFLLSDEIEAFLEIHVPNFLKAVPSSTSISVEEIRGLPRSRVDWQRTASRRPQLGNDPARFVTRPLEKTNKSSAAALVAYLLDRCIGLWILELKSPVPELARERFETHLRLARRYQATLKAIGVVAPRRLSGADVRQLRRANRPDVLASVLLFDLLVSVVENASENLFRNLLRRSLFAPERHDDLFEVWALLTLVGNHMESGWDLQDARLVGGYRTPKKPRFTLQRGADVAEIYFQTIPSEMSVKSQYKNIFSDYDLGAALRRPDITVKVTTALGSHRYLIEVKRTRDPGYITDSVYKTLGYISDFAHTVGPSTPFAYLLVWDGVEPVANAAHDGPVRIVTAAGFKTLSLPY